MSELTLEFTDTLVVVTCWCGINHGVPENLRNYQQRQHRNGETVTGIYCPLGHTHVPAGKGEAQVLREKLEHERTRAGRLAAQRDQAEAARKRAEAQVRAQKGVATKARKRAKEGVCPCCNRTFKQLAAHMKTKHPGFDPEPSTA